MNKRTLAKEIYEMTAIRRTIREFSALADISVCESREHYTCTFANCKYSITQTMQEFENYLIDLCYQMKYKNDNS